MHKKNVKIIDAQDETSSSNERRRDLHSTLPLLYGDARRFKQVMLNLCRNAVKFTKNGFIEIKACYKGELLIVQIKDTGKGMTKEEIPYVFNRFGTFQRTAS